MNQKLKKIRRSLWKNIWIIVISAVVFIMLILFIQYGSDIDDNTTNVIMALGAILSAFFMFLAFKETRKSNEIRLKEDEFQDLKKKVGELEIKANEKLFNDQTIKELSSTVNYSDSKLNNITYSNFIYPFHDLFAHIYNYTNYKECIELFSGTNRYKLNTIGHADDTLKLDVTFDTINKGISLLTTNYFRLYFLYEDIDASSILDERKKYLFNKLNRITDEFRYFFIDQIDKSDASFSTSQFDSTRFLKEFETFKADETKGIVKKTYSSFHSIRILVNYLHFRNKYA
jgi:hypothetical protein